MLRYTLQEVATKAELTASGDLQLYVVGVWQCRATLKALMSSSPHAQGRKDSGSGILSRRLRAC